MGIRVREEDKGLGISVMVKEIGIDIRVRDWG